MANGTGSLDLVKGARRLLIEETAISNAGVYLTRAPRVADVPYVLLQVVSNVALKTLGNGDAFRIVRLQIKSVAGEAGGRTGGDIANDLQAKAYARLFKVMAGETAQVRWNRHLNPLGWAVGEPMEKGDIGPYDDMVAELERWHVGHFADLRINKI